MKIMNYESGIWNGSAKVRKWKSAKAMMAVMLAVTVGAITAVGQQAHEYVVSPPAVWQELHDGGWDINSNPVYSNDSSRVLFDKDGNVPFSAGELQVLQSYLDVTIVGSDSIHAWMAANGFTQQEGL